MTKIIKKIKKRIDDAIEKLILKAKKMFAELMRKGKGKVKDGAEKLLGWWERKKEFKTIDGENHKLYFKGQGKGAKLMRASNDPQPLGVYLNSLDIPKTDDRYIKVTKAKEIHEEVQLITRTHGKTGEDENTTKKIEDKIVAKITELSVLLFNLVELTLDDVPDSADWNYSPDGTKEWARVEKLSHKTAVGGTGASGGNDNPEWAYITKMKNKSSDAKKWDWVRMHLITHSIGGTGEKKNWVPAPGSAVNSSAPVLSSFEKSLDKLVRSKAIPASTGVRGKSGRAETPNVVWVSVRVTAQHPSIQDGDKTLSGFASSVLFEYGLYAPPKEGSKEWIKLPKALSSQNVKIPKPEESGTEIYLLNHSTSSDNMKHSGISHFTATYGKKLIKHIKNLRHDTRDIHTFKDLGNKLKALGDPSLSDAIIDTVISDFKANSNKVKLK